MNILNFEFKAAVPNIFELEQKLLKLNPIFIGEDHQTDTYFVVPSGRLKLREGNIENSLIHYERDNGAAAKSSTILLYQHQPSQSLKDILIKTLGVRVVVKKMRKIYFIENVKFHFDTLADLGTFVEVEAIDDDSSIGIEELRRQCLEYAEFLGIGERDLLPGSYSDMILEQQGYPEDSAE